jgi:hypothetical protein
VDFDLLFNLSEVQVPFFLAESAKKNVFSSNFVQFLANFSKNLEINKNHLNTLHVQILGQLDHYWTKMAIFGHFLAHFGLYNYIGETCAGRHTPFHVNGHNF